MTEKKQYNNKIKLKPVPLLDGIEEIKEDFEERIRQGDLKYNFEILDDYVETIRAGSVTYILARPNCLALNTHVLTAEGFKQVTELTIKDKVIGIDGLPYDILDIVDTDIVDCYTLTTSDGRQITSSDNHRWTVYNRKRKQWYIFTSKELFEYEQKHPKEFKYLELPNFMDCGDATPQVINKMKEYANYLYKNRNDENLKLDVNFLNYYNTYAGRQFILELLNYGKICFKSPEFIIKLRKLVWSIGLSFFAKPKYTRDKYSNPKFVGYEFQVKERISINNISRAGRQKTRCPITKAPLNLIVVDNYIVTMNTGKSLLSQILANNIAKQGKKVLICSCEMGAGLIMERQLLNLTGTTNSQLKYMYEQHRDTANKIMDSIKENDNYEYLKNIDICETGGATVEDIMQMLDCFPEFDIIIIDYIQRIKGSGTEYENITYANRELQTYARRTRKPIIICSQAKRASEQGGKMSTSLENAGAAGKGSGSIEEDADVGILLSNLSEGDDRAVLVTLFKNRFGYKDVTYKYILDNRLNFVLEQKRWIDTKNDKKKQ